MTLLSVDEAAEQLQVSRRTIYRWISDGVLPGVQHGRSVRVPADRLPQVSPPARRRTAATDSDVTTHVLDAARSVLSTEGASGLTIERVAAVAGMSVGGVLYHFPTKAALVDGVVDDFLAQFEADWTAARAAGSAAADAYVELTLDARGDHRRARAVLLAAADRPEATARIQRRVAAWYRTIAAESEDPDDAVRRCLAADALWLFDLLGLRPVPRRQAVRATARR
jgi:excisionase family DNA binding protein